MKRALLAAALLSIPTIAAATTAPDLSARVVIDGATDEYAADEWVLDATSPRPERPGDSQWGRDNDVHRVALTWDSTFLYIAVDCATYDSGLMVWIEYAPGGISRLDGLGDFRRQISFSRFAPNYIVWADRGDVFVARVSASQALQLRSEDEIPRAFSRNASGEGALEIAVPWSESFPAGGVLRLIAAVTGVTGTGTGDSAPDPSVALPAGRTDQATLDQVLAVTVDAGGDRKPDIGIAPAGAATVEPGGVALARSSAEVELVPTEKTFAPELSQSAEFVLVNNNTDPVRVYLSARVYAMDGRLVRVLYEDNERLLDPGTNSPNPLDTWNGIDGNGEPVAGGIYVFNLVWGEERGAREGSFNASVGVVR